ALNAAEPVTYRVERIAGFISRSIPRPNASREFVQEPADLRRRQFARRDVVSADGAQSAANVVAAGQNELPLKVRLRNLPLGISSGCADQECRTGRLDRARQSQGRDGRFISELQLAQRDPLLRRQAQEEAVIFLLRLRRL